MEMSRDCFREGIGFFSDTDFEGLGWIEGVGGMELSRECFRDCIFFRHLRDWDGLRAIEGEKG